MGPPTNAMLEALHPARRARRAHVERPARHAWSPASRTAIRRCSRRSSTDARHHLVGARDPRHRRGLERAGARGLRVRLLHRRASASSGSTEAVQICAPDVPRGRAELRRHLLPRRTSALNVPRPVTPGGPPILIGGSGERWTLRLVAERADACNLFGDVETIRHKISVIEAALRRGRARSVRDHEDAPRQPRDRRNRGGGGRQAPRLRGQSRPHRANRRAHPRRSAVPTRSPSRRRRSSTPGSTGSSST